MAPMSVAALGAALVLLTAPAPASQDAVDDWSGSRGQEGHWGWTGAGVCPHFCTCYKSLGMRTVECVGRRLVGVDLALPRDTEVAWISDNFITSLGDGCFQEQGLVQVKELHLSHNAIRQVSPNAFAGLRRLHFLDLSYNHLQMLHPNTFASNHGLKTLHLAGNNLARLPPDRPLLSAPHLQILDLSSCKVAHLGTAVLSELPALASLNLSANYLIQLQPQTLAAQSQLQVLDLTRNPLACDLNTRQLQQLLESRNVTVHTSCPAPRSATHLQAAKHLERLLADVEPAPAAEDADGHQHVEVMGGHGGQGTKRQTHQEMVELADIMPRWEPEPESGSEYEEYPDYFEPTTPVATTFQRDCSPLFPDRRSKNPVVFRDWFDLIPSFWAAVFGFQVGMVTGVLFCACNSSFWRAICSCGGGSRPRRGAARGAARLSPEMAYADVSDSWTNLCVLGSASTSASSRLLLGVHEESQDQGSSCDRAERAETPPPAYSELMQQAQGAACQARA